LLHKGKDGEVYNIGVDNEISNIDITRMVLKLMGKSDDMIEFVKDRPGHDRRYAIDSSKITKLGWTAQYTKENFEKGLKETIDWYLGNKDWVAGIQNKKAGEMNVFER
jgi:dTDP-glucose 4,6-dehydratase